MIDESALETEEEEEPEEPLLHQVPGKAPKDEEKPVPMAPKQKRNPQNDEYWDSVVGKQSSTRERKPTAKAQIQAVSTDPDYPTEEQAHNSPIAAKWAKARARERAQLENTRYSPKCKKLISRKAQRLLIQNGYTWSREGLMAQWKNTRLEKLEEDSHKRLGSTMMKPMPR